jgi:hypothetical protein
MPGKLRRLVIKASLLVMGLATVAHAQSSGGGLQVCPPFKQFLTPTFLDFLLPGFSTRT